MSTPDAPRPTTDAAADETPGTRRFVIAACLIAFGLFVLSLKLLYGSWVTTENPTGLIVVQGDPTTDDAVITVTSPGELRAPLTAKISTGQDHRVRFHVPPGRYAVNVDLPGRRPGGTDVVDVRAAEAMYITLTPRATTRPEP